MVRIMHSDGCCTVRQVERSRGREGGQEGGRESGNQCESSGAQ